MAYRAFKDKTVFMVVDGTPGKPYTTIGNVVFSPDSLKAAHLAFDGKTWLWVVNGRDIHTGITGIIDVAPLVFDDASHLHGIGIIDTPEPECFLFSLTL
jgi:hypothetical protein